MPSVGTASAGLATITKNVNWTAAPGTYVLADASGGPITITLPAAPGNGVTVGVKKIDTTSNVVTVVGTATGTPAVTPTIDLDTNVTLTAQGVGAIFVFDGTNWQINSTAVTNAATSTASASGGVSDGYFAPGYTSGYWYDRRVGTPAAGGSTTSVTLAASTIYYVPLYLYKSVTISAVALYVSNAASSAIVRLGAYKADATTYNPSTLISDFGTLSVTAVSGLAVITLGTALTLPKGFSFAAISVNSVSWSSIGPAVYNMMLTGNQGFSTAASAAANANNGTGAVGFTATGDANASALASTVPSLTAAYGATMPHFYFRIA